MIEAVLLFGAITAIFEVVLLCMLRPRTRLRLLGSANSRSLLHISFLLANLIIHWGTLIGTMSAVLAFITSIATTAAAMRVFGYIEQGRWYTVGFIKYSVEELQ